MSPDYIVSNWSNEMLLLMVDKLAERRRKESEAYSGKPNVNSIPEEQFFKQAGIKVVKH